MNISQIIFQFSFINWLHFIILMHSIRYSSIQLNIRITLSINHIIIIIVNKIKSLISCVQMNNDSFVSTFTNNSFTQSLKPRLFLFSGSNPEKSKFSITTFVNLSQSDPYQEKNYGVNMKALRPKLSPKKLMEDPKFLLSLQRRKNRIISGFEASNFLDEDKLILDKKKRNFSHMLARHSKSNNTKKKEQFHKKQDNIYFNNNFKKQHKTPYMNFNLHHLLKRKKNFDVKNNNSNGSSEAFYSTYLLGNNNDRPIHSSDSFRTINRKSNTRFSASALSHRRGSSLS